MNSNRCLIILLFFGSIFAAPFANDNDEKQSHLNSSNIPVVLEVARGGGKNKSPESGPKIASDQVPRQMTNSQNQRSQSSGSSPSSSKSYQSSWQPGNQVRYSPSGNPSGSGGSGNSGYEGVPWESKASCPNPDEIISNPSFWNSYLDSKDCCPNFDNEFEDNEDWEFEDVVEIPDEILAERKRRRKLFTSGPRPAPPTAKLDKAVKDKFNFSTYDLQPFKYYSKEGIELTIKNKELEKIVYSHSDDINLPNFADKIMCPVQPDPSKFQRTECRAITDMAKKEALVTILDLTTTVNPDYITRKIPMPSFPSQDALAYIDTETLGGVFFHADSHKLWSAKKFTELELAAILNNPNFENLN